MDTSLHLSDSQVYRDGAESFFIINGCLGKDGYHTTLFHQFQQNVHIIRFHTYLEMVITSFTYDIESVTCLQSLGRKYQIIILQFGDTDTFLMCQRMVFTDNDRQMIIEQEMLFDILVQFSRTEGQCKIHLILFEHLHQLGHRLIENIEFDLRIKLDESK